MRNKIQLIVILFVLLAGCRKNDETEKLLSGEINRFLSLPEKTIIPVSKMAEYLLDQENSSEYMAGIVQEYGFPQWQQALYREADDGFIVKVPLGWQADSVYSALLVVACKGRAIVPLVVDCNTQDVYDRYLGRIAPDSLMVVLNSLLGETSARGSLRPGTNLLAGLEALAATRTYTGVATGHVGDKLLAIPFMLHEEGEQTLYVGITGEDTLPTYSLQGIGTKVIDHDWDLGELDTVVITGERKPGSGGSNGPSWEELLNPPSGGNGNGGSSGSGGNGGGSSGSKENEKVTPPQAGAQPSL